MPRRIPKPHELKTDEAMRKMFPAKVREAVKQEAEKSKKSGANRVIPRKNS